MEQLRQWQRKQFGNQGGSWNATYREMRSTAEYAHHHERGRNSDGKGHKNTTYFGSGAFQIVTTCTARFLPRQPTASSFPSGE